jgi:thiamine-phosphate pyrophosphorylase
VSRDDRGGAPALYIITDRRATGGRDLVAVVARALEGIAAAGATGAAVAVQLREKDLEARALLALARQLRAVTSAAGTTLYVNDRVDVAVAAGADGVHLSGTSLSPSEVRAIAPDLPVAVSAHSVAELRRAVDDRGGDPAARIRFAVVGPVFDTPSKRAFGPPVGLDTLRAAAELPLPVLALGGVDHARAASCLTVGARGVACIRAVLGAPDPAQAVTNFLLSVFMRVSPQ